MRKIILFELNEVPFRVIDHFALNHPNSSMAKILNKGEQYVTLSSDTGHLHPWSTWPTVHRGVTNETHKIKDIGENLTELNTSYPAVWDILINKGVSSGIFSSLHTYPLPSNVDKYKFFVPDPFAAGFETQPKSIEPFQAFNLMMSRASARNASRKINIKTGLLLVSTMVRIGVKFKSFKDLFKQLIDERFEPWKTTRRRTYQSVLAFDIFYKLLKKEKPEFTTFFSNHAASTMHRYWAATFPEDYDNIELGDDWIKKYSGEIDFAMSKLDYFLSKILTFINKNPEYKLLITSSMGQQATQAKSLETELAVKDLNKFVSKLGMSDADWEPMPAMHPQYNVKMTNERGIEQFKKILSGLSIDGKLVQYRSKDDGFFSIDFGHVNLKEEVMKFNDEPCLFSDFGLENEKIQEEASGTAYHVPEGSLIVFDPQTEAKPERVQGVDTTRIAPSILKNFGIDIPDYMSKDLIPSIADV